MRALGERLLRKARGIAGLGLVGGAVGLLAGGVLGLVNAVVDMGFYLDAGYWSFLLARAAASATFLALPAAFATASFGLLLGVTDGRRSLLDLPLWRMALLGALGGSLFVPVYVLARVGLSAFAPFPVAALPTIGIFAGLGGVLAASLTAIAKRAHRAELELVEEVRVLAGPE